LRLAWLRDASHAAHAAKDPVQAGAWERALVDLTPATVEKK